jgi:hypothetical protein
LKSSFRSSIIRRPAFIRYKTNAGHSKLGLRETGKFVSKTHLLQKKSHLFTEKDFFCQIVLYIFLFVSTNFIPGLWLKHWRFIITARIVWPFSADDGSFKFLCWSRTCELCQNRALLVNQIWWARLSKRKCLGGLPAYCNHNMGLKPKGVMKVNIFCII